MSDDFNWLKMLGAMRGVYRIERTGWDDPAELAEPVMEGGPLAVVLPFGLGNDPNVIARFERYGLPKEVRVLVSAKHGLAVTLEFEPERERCTHCSHELARHTAQTSLGLECSVFGVFGLRGAGMTRKRRKRTAHPIRELVDRSLELGEDVRAELDDHTQCALITLASAYAYLARQYARELTPEQQAMQIAALRELAFAMEKGLDIARKLPRLYAVVTPAKEP